jgi:hypothetical protein
MRWPWRRKKSDRVVFIGTSPFDVAQVIAATPTRTGVQLGFADGTTMTLEENDPRAVAFRAAAARLTGTS